MPDLLTPGAEVAAEAAPVLEVPTPSPQELHALVGGIPMECEVNAVTPCTKRHPQPAEYIIVWAECNCDPADPNFEGTTPICKADIVHFLALLRGEGQMECAVCEYVFTPAGALIKELLTL